MRPSGCSRRPEHETAPTWQHTRTSVRRLRGALHHRVELLAPSQRLIRWRLIIDPRVTRDTGQEFLTNGLALIGQPFYARFILHKREWGQVPKRLITQLGHVRPASTGNEPGDITHQQFTF